MRIISGKFKGKKLLIPKDNYTRPLKDVVKESIFNILHHSKLLNCNLSGSNVLDLFSGVGTFGLECISRNSKHVTFFENHYPALKILRKTIENLNCSKKTRIINKDVFNLKNTKTSLGYYEFIFLDPPFKEIRIKFLLNMLKEENILRKNSIILVHREREISVELPKDFKILINKNYGRSKILFGKFY